MEHFLVGIATILVLGIAAQWLAWRLRLPSILVLLIFGFIAGPITGFLDPNELLGDLLFPVVSVSVAIILFEGGLSLKIADLRQTRHVVLSLITVGAVVTWLLSAGAAHYILHLDWPLALLFGAILVVTGPTVIMPLLRHIRAVGRISSIVKWEGIVNDPIGAVLAVLVFEAILVTGIGEATTAIATSILKTIAYGVVFGGLGAWILIQVMKRYWVPDYLQNAVTLMILLAAFTVSNVLQEESGLFTVTLMGILLANQRQVSIKHIIEFKENLGVLLLSSLFIILAARLELESLTHIGLPSLGFLVVLVLVIRPACILLSTIKSGLSWQEKLFLSWMAPRGIVAAAVTAVFALELVETAGYIEAEVMVPEMFFIIVGTVTIYGLSAAPLGRWLNVADPNPQGTLIAGAHPLAQAIGKALQEEDYKVLLVDNNRDNIRAARLNGLPTVYASILSEYIVDKIEMGSLRRMLALTPNDEVNSLATLHFMEQFGRAEVYQLAPKKTDRKRDATVSAPLRGRLLFDSKITYSELTRRLEAGAIVKATPLTKQFNYEKFQEFYNGEAISLFLIDEIGNLLVFTSDNGPLPQPGDTIISLVEPIEESLSPNPVPNAVNKVET